MDTTTGSKLVRAEICPSSMALPCVHEVAGKYATDGTDIHGELEDIARGNREGKPAWLLDLYETLTEGATAVYAERCLAWNPETGEGRDLGTHGRDYSGLRPGEIPCTIDLLVIRESSGALWDYKSGFMGAPVESAQLSHQALASAGAFGLDYVTAGIVKLDAAQANHVLKARGLDTIDLAGEADRVRSIVARVAKARADYAAGKVLDVRESEDGCRYCPCWSTCPAKTNAIVQVGRLVGLQLPDPAKLMVSAADTAAVYQIVKTLEDFVKAAKEIAVERGRREKLPLPNGGFLSTVVTETETVGDIDKAVATTIAAMRPAREEGQSEEQYAAAQAAFHAEVEGLVEVKRSLSKDAIDTFVRAKTPRAKKGQPGKEAVSIAHMERLRAAGVFKTSPRASLKAFAAPTAAELKEAANG